jgi:hypothetical protein
MNIYVHVNLDTQRAALNQLDDDLVSCAGNPPCKSRLSGWLERGGRRPWWS